MLLPRVALPPSYTFSARLSLHLNLPQDGSNDAVSTFAPTSGGQLVTCSRNMLMRVWDLETGACVRHWKAHHRLPMLCCDVDASGTLFAVGSADRTISVWDIDAGHATHSFKSGHEGIITTVRFVPHAHSVERLVSASEDGAMRVWDLITSSCVGAMTEHMTAVTSLVFPPPSSSSTLFVSAGRDKVMGVWDLRDVDLAAARDASANSGSKKAKDSVPVLTPKATVPVFEAIEAAVAAPDALSLQAAAAEGVVMTFFTGGEGGLLRKWVLKVTGGDGSGPKRVSCVCVSGRRTDALRAADADAVLLGGAAKPTTEAAAADSHQIGALLVRPAPLAALAAAAGQGEAKKPGAKKGKAADGQAASSLPRGADVELVVVTRDRVLNVLSAEDALLHRKTLVGDNDEIVDVAYLPLPPNGYLAAAAGGAGSGSTATLPATAYHASQRRVRLAMATNSEQLRIIDPSTLDALLCDGHSDILVALSVSPDGTLVATASKDKTARVWDAATGVCLAVCEGHTESVSCVAWPVKPAGFTHAVPALGEEGTAGAAAGPAPVVGANGWLLTGSKDRTLKLWDLSVLLSKLPSPRPAAWNAGAARAAAAAAAADTGAAPGAAVFKPRTRAAMVAHEKDVNAIAVAPHDRMVATASQDKTVKLWSLPDLVPLATLRGHRRGVWGLAFSPSDQVLATASADRTVRLWSVVREAGYACLRTLEGHDASVLTVRYLRRGAQLMSAGGDGLVKLWNVADGECVGTFDGHSAKVWALAVRPSDPRDPAPATPGTPSSEPAPGPTPEYEVVSAGGDAVLNVWHDVTSSEAAEDIEATEAALMKQSSLYAAMAMRDYTKAVTLTLELGQPGRCGDILQEMLEVGPTPPTAGPGITPAVVQANYREKMVAELRALAAERVGDASAPAAAAAAAVPGLAAPVGSEKGRAMLTDVIAALSPLHLGRLLHYVRDWNTQSRHGLLAQQLLHIVLRTCTQARLLEAVAAFTETEALVKVIPGVGSVVVAPKAKSATRAGGDNGLAPLPRPVNEEEDSGAASSRPATAATSVLASLVSTMLPYAERHAERLERLLVSSYAYDNALAAMARLGPVSLPPDALTEKAAAAGGRSSSSSKGSGALVTVDSLMGLDGPGAASAALARRRQAEKLAAEADSESSSSSDDDF